MKKFRIYVSIPFELTQAYHHSEPKKDENYTRMIEARCLSDLDFHMNRGEKEYLTKIEVIKWLQKMI